MNKVLYLHGRKSAATEENQLATEVKMQDTISLSEVRKVEKWGKTETAVYYWPPVDIQVPAESVRRCYSSGRDAVGVVWERELRRWIAFHMRNPNTKFQFDVKFEFVV